MRPNPTGQSLDFSTEASFVGTNKNPLNENGLTRLSPLQRERESYYPFILILFWKYLHSFLCTYL